MVVDSFHWEMTELCKLHLTFYNIFMCRRFVMLLCLATDAVRLIMEKGFRDNSHYYHLGDGSYAYHVNLETASSIYFKCVMYDKFRCSGRAILRVGGQFRHSNHHNHPPDPDYVGERHFRANVLEQCRGARYVAFNDILDQARRDRR